MLNSTMRCAVALVLISGNAWAGGKSVVRDYYVDYTSPIAVTVDNTVTFNADNSVAVATDTTQVTPQVSGGQIAQNAAQTRATGAVSNQASATSNGLALANANREPFKLPKWLRGDQN